MTKKQVISTKAAVKCIPSWIYKSVLKIPEQSDDKYILQVLVLDKSYERTHGHVLAFETTLDVKKIYLQIV